MNAVKLIIFSDLSIVKFVKKKHANNVYLYANFVKFYFAKHVSNVQNASSYLAQNAESNVISVPKKGD